MSERQVQLKQKILQQQQAIYQQQEWVNKHEEQQQQQGLWHAEAESGGAYCDRSEDDVDRLLASLEQGDDKEDIAAN